MKHWAVDISKYRTFATAITQVWDEIGMPKSEREAVDPLA